MTTRPLIVCVDDDPEMLETVVRCLQREAFDVRGTTSVAEVLEWIARDDVAVLVSDFEMPEMTGAQLASQARRLCPETVRILLTGMRTIETAIDGINQGEVFRFISKPYEDKQLRAAVLAGVARHGELVGLSGYRQRRERREALRVALEAEFPGISQVTRAEHERYEVTGDPLGEAIALGLGGLSAVLERT